MSVELIENENTGNEVYWASTREYLFVINNDEYEIRTAEDSNGAETLILTDDGWESLWSWDQDICNEIEKIISEL